MTRLPEAQLKRGMDAEGYQLHSVYLTYQAPWLASLELRMRLTLWPDDEEKSLPGRNYKLALSYQF